MKGKKKIQKKDVKVQGNTDMQGKPQKSQGKKEEVIREPVKVSRSGKLQGKEPNNVIEFMASPDCVEKFKEAGWLGFLQCLKGYHSKIAMAFAKSLMDMKLQWV